MDKYPIIGEVPADRFRCVTCGEIRQEGLSIAATSGGKPSEPLFLWICSDCSVSLSVVSWLRFGELFAETFDFAASFRIVEMLRDLQKQAEHIAGFLQGFIQVPDQVREIHEASVNVVERAMVEPCIPGCATYTGGPCTCGMQNGEA